MFRVGDEELLEYRASLKRFIRFSSVVSASGDRRHANCDSGLSTDDSRLTRRLAPLTPIMSAISFCNFASFPASHTVATTISILLDATRAHVRFCARARRRAGAGECAHVAELARRYEAEGGILSAGSSTSCVSRPKTVRRGGAILEEGRRRRAHDDGATKPKASSFPSSFLRTLTAKLHTASASRYIDADRGACAIRIAGCSPFDLIQHEPEELARAAAEGCAARVRRRDPRRDLLVVPAVGDEQREGWIDTPTVRSNARTCKTPASGRARMSAFKSKDSVLMRPNGDGRLKILFPGPARVGTSHSVVWWDPRDLN